MMTSPTVQIAGVSKRYGERYAVRALDLALEPGECVALVGHNGAGKSTLIKMMLGLTQPSEGGIAVLGEDPSGPHASRLRASMGFLPENVAFAPAMTGREVLDFYARLRRLPVAANGALLERVGLGEAARRRVGTYSKGMRQRLGLAQALLGAPRVLLLDEPTSGLDPISRQSFYELVRELRETGATVLLSSHALSEIEDRTDRIAVMSHGRLVACGTLSELRALAPLPVRIRVHFAEKGSGFAGSMRGPKAWEWLDERRLELTCANDTKVETLRELSSMKGIADIEIIPPTLDEIYAHMMREAAE
ncbi:MAG TPA: ABC transporter ATP-binding protein [Stellaceae bacterium]|nr:ABC transporter ATP-binding protein [Stellaceae bacterium]